MFSLIRAAACCATLLFVLYHPKLAFKDRAFQALDTIAISIAEITGQRVRPPTSYKPVAAAADAGEDFYEAMISGRAYERQ
ncbi:hypothetical protein [Stenotrophomonas maltophilia]|uniref:hypothetical protein n=1 Tax=Stenotrophomonas maltophilia TaxID=40324 RepID=UPI000D1AFE15